MGNRFPATRRRAIVDLLIGRDGGAKCLDPNCESPDYSADPYKLTVDHVDPTIRGRDVDALDNLRLLCRSCNGRRGANDRHAGHAGLRVAHTYMSTGLGTLARDGIDPNKVKSDADFAKFESRAIQIVTQQNGKALASDVIESASYGLVKMQTARAYFQQVAGRAGALRPLASNDKYVELRPESDRWRFDDHED